MSYSFQTLFDPSAKPIRDLNPTDFAQRVARLINVDAPRFGRLWNYYRNPQQPSSLAGNVTAASSTRPYRVAQEWGLPSRITGVRSPSAAATLGNDTITDVARKEVVVENDIAWRIDAMVDYLFGKPVTIRSTVDDAARQRGD